MISRRILFSKEETGSFLGRNGQFRCYGITVSGGTGTDFVLMEPIRKNGTGARCFIAIPKKDLKELTALLTAIQEEDASAVVPCGTGR